MASGKNNKETESLLTHAGITVPQDRLPALTFALAGARAQLQALSAYQYGLTEPAARFKAPR